MTIKRIPVEIHLTLADDLHDFDTLETHLEPLTDSINLEDHYDNPNDEFRYEILNELRDQQMWKAGLNNPEPDEAPYKTNIGTATINTETDEIQLDLDKTSHHSIEPHELTPRNS